MMSIKIVAVGKVKDIHMQSLIDEYAKRLRPFARVEIIEVAHEPFRDIGEKEKAQKAEAEKILRAIGKSVGGVISSEARNHGMVVFLEERGKEMSSVEFAKWLSKLSERGETVTFVIGGALGLHPSLTHRGQSAFGDSPRLSLSPLTFPHELARVLLLEQCYRAVCILKGKIYHY